MDKRQPVRIGTQLYGYCGGCFGDNDSDKRVEAIGADWVVARDENGKAVYADVAPEALEEYTVRDPADWRALAESEWAQRRACRSL